MSARQIVGFLVAGALLAVGLVIACMALADSCAEYGGAWCYVSPAGDGYTNPRGEP